MCERVREWQIYDPEKKELSIFVHGAKLIFLSVEQLLKSKKDDKTKKNANEKDSSQRSTKKAGSGKQKSVTYGKYVADIPKPSQQFATLHYVAFKPEKDLSGISLPAELMRTDTLMQIDLARENVDFLFFYLYGA